MNEALYRKNTVLFSITALLSLMPASVQGILGQRTIIMPRSQSVNAARDLVGWQQEIYRPSEGRNYWAFAFTPEYTHTFQSKHLTVPLFGDKRIKFTGSAVEDRCPGHDVLADYLGLPRDFESTWRVCPRISQFIADFNWFVGLDRVCENLYVRFHFPVVHSKWDIRRQECIQEKGTAFYPAGYFSENRIERKNLLSDVNEYFEGFRTIGDMKEPILYNKVIGLTGRNVRNRLSDVQAAVGYQFLRSDSYHLGLEARASAPAGNRPSPELLFDAVVGNGHHWELGAGLTGHYRIWEHGRYALLVYLDANVTHLFSVSSKRSFDLCGRCPGSRFLPLEEIARCSRDLFIDDEPAPHQYFRRLIPAINVTTLPIDTSFAVQADIALKFALCRDNFCLDLGYNFWGRSSEKTDGCVCFENGRYAIKGDAQIYGFNEYDPYDAQAIPLSATQDMATIHAGQGYTNFVAGSEFANDNADNPKQASSSVAPLLQLNSQDSYDLNIMQQPVMTSKPVKLLCTDDLDIASGLMPKSFTNKFFMHAGYTWYATHVDPFLGLGGEIEWAHGLCDRGGISQWGIWVKTGVSY